jgi:PAB1-binding protein PBP1
MRELQKWQPDEDDSSSALLTLEAAPGGAPWDQFAVNRDRFGVQTTWSEDFYTSKVCGWPSRCV